MPKYRKDIWNKIQRDIKSVETGGRGREVIPEYRGRPGTEQFEPGRLWSARERGVAVGGGRLSQEGGLAVSG